MSAAARPANLTRHAGKVISIIRRIWYVLHGEVSSASGPIELSFSDGSAILLDAGPDGETLSVSEQPWRDPFEGQLSQENEMYIRQSGKWTAFDVSGEAPYARLIGRAVEGVEPHLSPDGKPIGVTLRAGNGVLRAEVEADELHVDVM